MIINKSAIILYSSTKGKKERGDEYLTLYKNRRYLELSLDSVRCYDEVIILNNELENELGFIKNMYRGLSKIKNSKALVISTEMPLVGEKILNYMGNISFDEDILVPFVNGKPCLDCAIYSKSIIPYLKNMIKQKSNNINELFNYASIRYVFPKENILFSNVKKLEKYLISIEKDLQ